ncbi:MAG: DNA-processing protein DprA [Bacteroidales bacterium]
MKLTRVPKLGPKRILNLFSIFKSIENVVSASDADLIRTRVFTEEMVSEWNKLKDVSDDNFYKAIDECKKHDIQIITIFDDIYPENLKRVPYPPLTLFLKGDISLLNTNKVAVVGSRESDEHAKDWAYKNSQIIAKNNLTVISGGAIGIDTMAHKGALSVNGKTICVLGTGFFKMYPEENNDLFREILEKGLFVSEHLPNFPGSRISHIQRNRITSGLANALIMVASGEKGGSMVQTKMAFEQRVPIFCPKKSLNLQPNTGLTQVINEWKGKEIDTVIEVIDCAIQNKKSNENIESLQRFMT